MLISGLRVILQSPAGQHVAVLASRVVWSRPPHGGSTPPGTAVAYQRALRLRRYIFVSAACAATHPEGMVALHRLIELGRCAPAGSKCRKETNWDVFRERASRRTAKRTQGIRSVADSRRDESKTVQHSAAQVPQNIHRLCRGRSPASAVSRSAVGGQGRGMTPRSALGRYAREGSWNLIWACSTVPECICKLLVEVHSCAASCTKPAEHP